MVSANENAVSSCRTNQTMIFGGRLKTSLNLGVSSVRIHSILSMIVINSIHRYSIGQKIEVSVQMLEVEHFRLPYDLLYSIDSKIDF